MTQKYMYTLTVRALGWEKSIYWWQCLQITSIIFFGISDPFLQIVEQKQMKNHFLLISFVPNIDISQDTRRYLI